MDLFKQLFLIKPGKLGKSLKKNCLCPQSGPHTAKLCFSVVLKHFWGNLQRTSLLVKKVAISERSTEKLRIFFLYTCLKRGKSEENFDLFKQIFLIQPVKWVKS